MPNQAMRIVAKPRKRFCPIPTNKSSFEVISPRMMSSREVSGSWTGANIAYSPLVARRRLKLCRNRVGETHRIREVLLPIQLRVDSANACRAVAFGCHKLLFQQRRQELVRVLHRAHKQRARRVDLIQDRNLGIE